MWETSPSQLVSLALMDADSEIVRERARLIHRLDLERGMNLEHGYAMFNKMRFKVDHK